MASEIIIKSDTKSPEHQALVDFHLKHLAAYTAHALMYNGVDTAYIFPPQRGHRD